MLATCSPARRTRRFGRAGGRRSGGMGVGPDDRATGRSRGLTVIAEEYTQVAKFYREADGAKPNTVPKTQWSWLDERTSKLDAIRRELDAIRDGHPPGLDQTRMIGTALDTAFPSDEDKRASGRLSALAADERRRPRRLGRITTHAPSCAAHQRRGSCGASRARGRTPGGAVPLRL